MTARASVIIIQRDPLDRDALARQFKKAGADVLSAGTNFAELEFSFKQHAINAKTPVDAIVTDPTFTDRVSLGFALERLSAAAKRAEAKLTSLPVITIRDDSFPVSERECDQAIMNRLTASNVAVRTIYRPYSYAEIVRAVAEIRKFHGQLPPTPVYYSPREQRETFQYDFPRSRSTTSAIESASLRVSTMNPYQKLVLRSLATLSIKEPGEYFPSTQISDVVRSDPNFLKKADLYSGNAKSVSFVLRFSTRDRLVEFQRYGNNNRYRATEALKQVVDKLE